MSPYGIFRRHFRTFTVIGLLVVYSLGISFALPPSTKYQPGGTLDPSCTPGSTNCSVQILPDQSLSGGGVLTTDGNTTSWTKTLTNLTLITPSIASITNGAATLSLPTTSDTLVGRTTTDTLTNKSLSGTSNTFTNIPNTALSNSSITINGQPTALGSSATITTTGTLNRISVTNGGTLTPTIDIANTYIGQSSITTLGTITTGTWNAGKVQIAATGDNTSALLITGSSTGTSMIDLRQDISNGTNTGTISLYAGNPHVLGTYLSGGTGNSYFNGGGNVGIGTTTPHAPLEVVGRTIASNFVIGPYANLNDTTGVSGTLQFGNGNTSFVTGSADAYLYKSQSLIGTLPVGSLIAQLRSDVTGGAFAIVGQSTPTPLMTVLAGGNVGIGTAAPAYTLDVTSGSVTTAARFSVTAGASLMLEKASGAALSWTKSGVQSKLIEDDAGGFGLYYGASNTLAATIGANSTFSGSVGINGASVPAWGGGYGGLSIGQSGQNVWAGTTNDIRLSANTYYNGTSYIVANSATLNPSVLVMNAGPALINLYSGTTAAVGAATTLTNVFAISNTGAITTGTWNAGSVSATGGMLAIANSNALTSRASTTGSAIYNLFQNSVGAGRGYVGFGSNSTSEMDLMNYEAGPLVLGTNTSVRYTIDSSGNNTWTGNGAFGSTPYTWYSTTRAVEIGQNTAVADNNSTATWIFGNSYYNSAATSVVGRSGATVVPTLLQINNSSLAFYNATAAATGSAITWVQRFLVDGSGNGTFSGGVTSSGISTVGATAKLTLNADQGTIQPVLYRSTTTGGLVITGQGGDGGLTVTGTGTFNGGAVASIAGAAASEFQLSSNAGNYRAIRFSTGSTVRWYIGANSSAEAGSNAGSDFAINSYSDAGALLSTPISIQRSSGSVNVANGITVSGGLSMSASAVTFASGVINYAGSNKLIAGTTSGANYLYTSSAGGLIIRNQADSATNITIADNGNLTSNANASFGNQAINAWGSGYRAIQIGYESALWSSNAGRDTYWSSNVYYNGTNYVQVGATFQPTTLGLYDGGISLSNAPASTAGAIVTPSSIFSVDNLGSINTNSQGRFKGWYTSGTGQAAEVGISSGAADFIGFDRTANAYLPVYLQGGTGGNTNYVYINGSLIGLSSASSTYTATNRTVLALNATGTGSLGSLIDFQANGTTVGYIHAYTNVINYYANGAASQNWYNNGSLGMTLSGTNLSVSGNLSAGTASAYAGLTVAASGLFNGGSGDPGNGAPVGVFVGYDATNSRGFINAVQTGVSARTLLLNQSNGAVETGGIFGVGSLAAATASSICYNTTTLTGYNTLGTCSSDQRLKQNITPLPDDTLSKVMQLNPVSFNWDPSFATDQTLQFGVIAQQVAQVFPNLVSKTAPTPLTPDGTYSVNFNGLYGPIIKSIQMMNIKVQVIPTETDTSLYAKITDFLRGIAERGEAVVNMLTTKNLCVSDDSGGRTCVTKSQLDQLLNSHTAPSSSSTSVSTPSPTPTTTPTPSSPTTASPTVAAPTPTAPAPTTPTLTTASPTA